MHVGVIKVSTTTFVEDAIKKLGHTPVVLQINDPEIVSKLKESPIKKWIGTGSNLRLSVLQPLAPQIPMEILTMKDKEFFLICYTMESLLYQLGYPVVFRGTFLKERFDLGPLRVYRHHGYYIPANKVDSKVKVTETYKGEVMTALYKNVVMTQWHPERTADGIQVLKHWLDT
jgi:GMP synthase-like glutamine amidotransferase